MGHGYRVWGTGYEVGHRVSDMVHNRVWGIGYLFEIGYRVQGTGYRVQGTRYRAPGMRYRVCGIGYRVSGIGYSVWGRGWLFLSFLSSGAAYCKAMPRVGLGGYALHTTRPCLGLGLGLA